MLYTIITDGKNSLFSTSYRPRGTVFKLVMGSVQKQPMSHITKKLQCICFFRKEISAIFTKHVQGKAQLSPRPRGPACSAGPELSQVTSMSRSTVRRDAARRSVLYQPKSDTNRTLFALLYCHICHHYITTIQNVRCRGAGRSRKKGLSRCSAGMGLMGFRLPSGDDGDNCVLSISLRCATAFGCKDSMQLLLTL